MTLYPYVGPAIIREGSAQSPTRCLIHRTADILNWIEQTGQRFDSDGTLTSTFVIDRQGNLWVADRHSEHIACAGGDPVLSAGEMTFLPMGVGVQVTAVTNQSTGFCPEPESWPVVAAALDRCGIGHPGCFTSCFHFRRCGQCSTLNLVKEDWFVCSVCDAELSPKWNLAESPPANADTHRS